MRIYNRHKPGFNIIYKVVYLLYDKKYYFYMLFLIGGRIMFFFKKEHKIHDMLMKHLDAVIECYVQFSDSLDKVLDFVSEDEVFALCVSVSKAEARADNIRHEIIKALLGGALLPESRREILILIDEVDKIANEAEEIIKQLMLQRISLEEPYKSNIMKINELTKKQLYILRETMDGMLSNVLDAYQSAEKLIEVDTIESDIDRIEEDTLRVLFKSDMELVQKMQLKVFISDFAKISDIAEDVSDVLEMIMVMRKV